MYSKFVDTIERIHKCTNVVRLTGIFRGAFCLALGFHRELPSSEVFLGKVTRAHSTSKAQSFVVAPRKSPERPCLPLSAVHPARTGRAASQVATA